jgi:hypothetical protein
LYANTHTGGQAEILIDVEAISTCRQTDKRTDRQTGGQTKILIG